MTDLISVIIPIYKAEPYLRRCVDSILAQTYTNLEVILVDDGSPDNCGAICDEYAEIDNRIVVIHQPNSGVSAARNTGLNIAHGDFVCFVDADDFMDSDMCESLLNVAYSECADVVECNYRRSPDVQGGSGKTFVHTGHEALIKLFTEDGYPTGFTVSPCAKLIRQSTAQNIHFLEGCSMAEDMLYVVELFSVSAKVAKLDRRLYTYWITPNSATNHAYRLSKADEVDAAYRAFLVMQSTGNPTISAIGAQRYVDLLLAHWYKCRALGHIGISKAAELRKDLLKHYSLVKTDLSKKQVLKCVLFRFFPDAYYLICTQFLEEQK